MKRHQNIGYYISEFLLIAIIGMMIGCGGSNDSPTTHTADNASNSQLPYKIEIKAPAQTKVGVETGVKIVVIPQSGYKINLEYPSKLEIKSVPEGAKLSARRITKDSMRLEKSRMVVPVQFTCEASGEKKFVGELRFSVCTEKTCKMPRENIEWTTLAEATTP